jgi:hypothetical protein
VIASHQKLRHGRSPIDRLEHKRRGCKPKQLLSSRATTTSTLTVCHPSISIRTILFVAIVCCKAAVPSPSQRLPISISQPCYHTLFVHALKCLVVFILRSISVLVYFFGKGQFDGAFQKQHDSKESKKEFDPWNTTLKKTNEQHEVRERDRDIGFACPRNIYGE